LSTPPHQLVDHRGRPIRSTPKAQRNGLTPLSRYEAAQNEPGSRSHWAGADDFGPKNANNPVVRSIIRRRARYERDNDPHLNGLTKTLAHDLIGTGPRLQLNADSESYASARLVEKSFAGWCRASKFADKLRLMREVRPVDGEAFALMVSNPKLPAPVKLDLRIVESELCATPFYSTAGIPGITALTDGIEFDSFGNPTFYHFLREHPGDQLGFALGFDRVPAKYVLHWFRPFRPGQARGVCEFAASLTIGAQTRRYAAAVLGSAELQASISGVMETDMPADGGAGPTFETMEEVDVPRQGLMTLPSGYKAKPFETNQPTGTYTQYVAAKREEMGRPVLAPYNVISGNSSGYNYSSGRLDHVPYQRYVWVERDSLRQILLDRVFLAWVEEAAAVGLIPDDLPAINLWDWEWNWDAFGSIDPLKDSAAAESDLQLKLTTRAEQCAARGLYWRDVIDQLAVEEEYIRSKGMDPAIIQAPKPAFAAPPAEDGGGSVRARHAPLLADGGNA
jgi:lambda family phage portal protein